MARDPELVTVSKYTVLRSDLTSMDLELRRYLATHDRLTYLRRLSPEASRQTLDGLPRSAHGDPTLAGVLKAEDAAAKIPLLEAWLEAVESVRKRLPDTQRDVMGYFYFLPWEQRDRTIRDLYERLHVSKAEIYRTRDEALLEFLFVLRGWEPSVDKM